MFGHAVVVAGDGARADVGARTDVGIADVGQMVDLGTGGDLRVLDLYEVADVHVLGQFRARTQAGVGADDRPARDVAPLEVAERADAGPGFDRDAGTEDDVRFDHRVTPQDSVGGEEHRIGCREGDAVVERLRAHPGLERGLGGGEFGPSVDAQRLGLGAADHGGGQTAVAGDLHDVGQVEFARRVVVRDLVEECEQGRGVRHDDAGIAQRDHAGGRVGIVVFHDPVECIARRDKPPVACRQVRSDEAQHHHVGTSPRGAHRVQRLAGDERRVAVKDHHISRRYGQGAAGLQDGVSGPALRVLPDRDHVVAQGKRGLFHRLGPDAGDHDDARRVQMCGRGQGMRQQRHPAQFVQDLGPVGIHPAALACRQEDRADVGHCPTPF